MTLKIQNKVKSLCVLILLLSMLPTVLAAEGDPDFDDMTGGMSGDATYLLGQILFWLVAACLVACLILGAFGILGSDSDLTKKSAKGFVILVGLVFVYFAASFTVEYLKVRYG